MDRTTIQWWGKKIKTTRKIGNHADVYMIPSSTKTIVKS
jgi:hypothetical protein